MRRKQAVMKNVKRGFFLKLTALQAYTDKLLARFRRLSKALEKIQLHWKSKVFILQN